MTWAFTGVAVAAGSAAMSYSQSASAAAGAANSSNRQVIRHNAKVVEANIENTVRTGFRVGLLNLQQGQAKRAFVQQGFETGAAAQQVLSATTANAAAAGQVGASVDAVEADVYMKRGEARAQQADAWEVQMLNFNNELERLIQEGKDTIAGADGEVAKINSSTGGMLGAAAAGGLQQFASSYLAKKIDLGLGKAPAGTSTAFTIPSTGAARFSTNLGTLGSGTMGMF